MSTILTTERVILRQLQQEDLDDLFRLNSNPQVMEYIAPVFDLATCQMRLDMATDYYQKEPKLGKLAAVLKDGGEFIGWFCLKHLEDSGEVEIGYRMLPEYWGKGIATEVSEDLVKYGFTEVGLKRIVGITRPDNIASERVLLKIGLIYEEQRHYYNTDVNYYALNIEDWKN